jgi:signal transduction histidine kinase/CheY-like chemotaxis protein
MQAEELKDRLTYLLTLLLLVGGTLGWTTVGAVGRFEPANFSIFLALSGVGLVSFLVRLRHPRPVRTILTFGLSLCLALALHLYANPLFPAFATLTVIAAWAMGPVLGVVASALNTGILLAMRPVETVTPVIAILWLASVIEWYNARGFDATLQWAWESQQRMTRLLEEVRDRRGELGRTLESLTEATRRLQRTAYELAIARQQAEEARHIKAQFAANVSHELRTPLNLIIGFSEMMYRTPEVYGQVKWTPALRADIREIYQSSRHLMGMIDDILDLSRIEAQRLPLRLEPTDIGDLIHDALATASGLLRGKPVTLSMSVPRPLPDVIVDCTRIRQVLLNLLNNAIRFTDQGRIEVSAWEENGEVAVAVSDTGVGIPAEEVPALFEEFRQAKGPITSGRGGTGLGLAICKQFVNLHGGRIEAESVLGEGSTFRFHLPLPDSGRAVSRLSYYAPEGWAPRAPENPLDKTVIILGQDLEAVGMMARAVQGYRALPVTTLEQLAAAATADEPTGVILLRDPYSHDGFEPEDVWRAIGNTDLPVLRCEVAMETVVTRELAVADYLVKPVRRERIIEAVQNACAHPSSLLVVDDDPGFVALLHRVLAAEWPEAEIHRAYSGTEALELLGREPVDAILLDLTLPGITGLEVLQTVRRNPRIALLPVIITTASSYGEELARLRGGRLELLRCDGTNRAELGRYIRVLLDASRTTVAPVAPRASPPASAVATPAS